MSPPILATIAVFLIVQTATILVLLAILGAMEKARERERSTGEAAEAAALRIERLLEVMQQSVEDADVGRLMRRMDVDAVWPRADRLTDAEFGKAVRVWSYESQFRAQLPNDLLAEEIKRRHQQGNA